MNYACPIEGKGTKQSVILDGAEVCLAHQCATRDRRGIFGSAGTDGNGYQSSHDFIDKRFLLAA